MDVTIKDVHEAIKTKQMELARRYAEANPSEVMEVYWLYAQRKKGTYPRLTSRCGKWLIFVDNKDFDAV